MVNETGMVNETDRARVRLGWRQVAAIAFGGWPRVAQIAGYDRPATAARWKEMPASMLDALMAAPDRPAWCTREMLMHGADVEMVFLRAADRGCAMAAE